MPYVKKISLSLLAVGLPIVGAFIALGFIEPYVSIPGNTAYGWDYWPWLILLVACFTFSPALYAVAQKITVKYGKRKITTSLTISGFWIRLIVALIGILLIGIVLEDALSLIFAEWIRQLNGMAPAGVFTVEDGFLWSAMGELTNWIGLTAYLPAYITVYGWQIPTLYLIFTAAGITLIALAVLAPRWRR